MVLDTNGSDKSKNLRHPAMKTEQF